jgi:hypothetical protein
VGLDPAFSPLIKVGYSMYSHDKEGVTVRLGERIFVFGDSGSKRNVVEEYHWRNNTWDRFYEAPLRPKTFGQILASILEKVTSINLS